MCACLRLTVALLSSAPSSNTTSLRRTTRWSASVNSGIRPMLVRTLSSVYSGLAVFPLTTITRPMVAGAGGAALFTGCAEYSISKARSPASVVRTSTAESRGAPLRRPPASPLRARTGTRGVRGRQSAPCPPPPPEWRDGARATRRYRPGQTCARRSDGTRARWFSRFPKIGSWLNQPHFDGRIDDLRSGRRGRRSTVHSIFHQDGEGDLAPRAAVRREADEPGVRWPFGQLRRAG